MMARPTPAGPNRTWKLTRRALMRTGFYLVLVVFVGGFLFPFYWAVVTALKTEGELEAGTSGIFPSHVTFSSFIADFTQSSSGGVNFLRSLENSVGVSLATTILTVVLASLAAYALARSGIRGRGVVLGFILLVGFFPIIAIVGPLFIAYRDIGWLDSYQGIVFAYLIYTLPLSTWFLDRYFAQIPVAIEEAAIIDGATHLQTLRKVIAPIALPGIFTTMIMSFILAWNDFTFAVSFLQSPSLYTAPLAVVQLGQGATTFEVLYNRIDAAVVIITIPIAVLVLVAQRRIVAGLTAGALK